MSTTLHTIETAPEASKPLLEGAQKSLGFIPNLFATFADSPATLKAYLQLSELLGQSDLDATEQQIVAIAASRENGCTYCVAAHTTIAQMGHVDPDTITALRNGTPLPSAKQEALRSFVNAVVNQRGNVSQQELETFYAAGYSQKHALSVILGVTMKVLSNYTNHIFKPELDAAFQPNAWSKSCSSGACSIH